MKTVNMHEAKTHLSRLVQAAVDGEPFVIARAGKPMVKVVAVEERPVRRMGFLEGQFTIPEDFDEMFREEIEEMFYGGSIFPGAPDSPLTPEVSGSSEEKARVSGPEDETK